MTKESPLRVVTIPGPKDWDEIDDDDLMLLTSGGRQDAFEVLVRRHQSLVYGLAARFFGDKVVGRDVAQDVFLSLWSERNRYQTRGRFRSFLVSMTLNRCQTIARKKKNDRKKIDDLAMEAETAGAEDELPLQSLVDNEKNRQVRHLLTRLPEKHRQAVILRFTHDMALEEISEAMDVPLSTVKSYLFRGLKKLSKLLTQKRPR